MILHLLKYNLSDFHSRFQSAYFTQDIPLHVVNSWFKAINDVEFVVVGFLDLAKASDYVDHGILLTKFKRYGIVGSIVVV